MEVEQQLDLHRLYALTRHWRQHPPVHILAAAYLQYEPPAARIMIDENTEVTGELAEMLGSAPLRTVPAIDDSAWLSSQAERSSE
jgi:hypothetical protein